MKRGNPLDECDAPNIVRDAQPAGREGLRRSLLWGPAPLPSL